MTLPDQTTRVFVDDPWEDVEQAIYHVAQEELCDPEGGDAAEKWSDEIATTIARRVMMHLTGGEWPINKHGLRAFPDA